MSLNFYKMSASGNDFIVFDNQKKSVRNLKKLAKDLCPRSISVGADGVLVMEKSSKADIKMRIFNADGSEAEMCGNGARCAALFSHEILKLPQEFTMETIAGNIDSKVGKRNIKVKLSQPIDYRDLSPIEVADGIFYYYFLNTGVPHVLVFEESIQDFPVTKIGNEIRYHEHFAPEGANVNFVEIVDSQSIKIRTYERGVEGETLACGTGSTAAAIVSGLIGKCHSPVQVETRGGDILKISFKAEKFDISDVYLEGKANFIYSGQLIS